MKRLERIPSVVRSRKSSVEPLGQLSKLQAVKRLEAERDNWRWNEMTHRWM